MKNKKNEKQCVIHDISCNFYNFAKNYIKIKDGANERFFNDEELKQVEEIQQMMDKGYELKLVHLRKGSKIMWCKKNENETSEATTQGAIQSIVCCAFCNQELKEYEINICRQMGATESEMICETCWNRIQSEGYDFMMP